MIEAVVILAGIAFTVNKIVSVLKAARARDWNTVLTQATVWLVGIGILFLVSGANQFQHLVVPGFTATIGDFDTPSKIMLGLMLGSSGSFAYDYLVARDNTQSAAEPKLFPSLSVTDPRA